MGDFPQKVHRAIPSAVMPEKTVLTRFVTRENIRRYRRLLENTHDAKERIRIQKLLHEAVDDHEEAMQLSRDTVREIYDNFVSARFDQLAAAMDENIDFISHAPADVFPYLGRRRGRTEVLSALSEVHEKLDIQAFFPLTTVVDEDQAAVTLVIKVKDRFTGRSANFLAAHFLRFRNGKIVDYSAIIDSLDAVRQLEREDQQSEGR